MTDVQGPVSRVNICAARVAMVTPRTLGGGARQLLFTRVLGQTTPLCSVTMWAGPSRDSAPEGGFGGAGHWGTRPGSHPPKRGRPHFRSLSTCAQDAQEISGDSRAESHILAGVGGQILIRVPASARYWKRVSARPAAHLAGKLRSCTHPISSGSRAITLRDRKCSLQIRAMFSPSE